MPARPDTFRHRRWPLPEVHRLDIRPFDATEPPPTTPAPWELDRATNIVLHHIAHEVADADTTGRHRNPWAVLYRAGNDLGAARLNPGPLADIVEDAPVGNEFPTWEARDAYEQAVRDWLTDQGYTHRRAA